MILGLLIFCVAWLILSLFHRAVLIRLGQDSVRYWLFAMRDDLRQKADAMLLDRHSFPFRYLDGRLSEMVKASKFHGVREYLRSQDLTESQRADVARFENESPPELLAIAERAEWQMFFLMLLHAPTVLIGGWSIWLQLRRSVNGLVFTVKRSFR